MKKVILIGGSPMVGKSTASVKLASKLLYPCIPTDDIGTVFKTISGFDPMKGLLYSDYYANTEKEQLIDDMIQYHKKYEAAIFNLIAAHSTEWSSPLIMEGWALYPNQVNGIKDENVFSVCLIAADGLLKKRVIMNKGFYQNAKEPEKVIENYLYRSEWHNKKIFDECKTGNYNYIIVKEETSTDVIINTILDMLT